MRCYRLIVGVTPGNGPRRYVVTQDRDRDANDLFPKGWLVLIDEMFPAALSDDFPIDRVLQDWSGID